MKKNISIREDTTGYLSPSILDVFIVVDKEMIEIVTKTGVNIGTVSLLELHKKAKIYRCDNCILPSLAIKNEYLISGPNIIGEYGELIVTKECFYDIRCILKDKPYPTRDVMIHSPVKSIRDCRTHGTIKLNEETQESKRYTLDGARRLFVKKER